MSYTEVSVTGYNTNPPPDDGSSSASNSVTWTKIKTKLFDPLKTALELIDDRVASAIATADAALASTSALVTAINNLSSNLNGPTGTVLLFQQTSPPTGWTKGAVYDDYALRLVTGTASTGGSTAFTSILAARTIATANLPSHTHSFSDTGRSVSFTGTTTHVTDVTDSNADSHGGGGAKNLLDSVTDVTSTLTGTYAMSCTSDSSGSGGSWDFAVRYVDLIYATKS